MPKRMPPLVSQYLEGVSRHALEKYQDVIRDFVRRRDGIYALYKGRRLYYVGLTTNLRGRLRSHLRDRHGHAWNTFSVYLTVGGRHLRELEALTMRIASPKGNSQKGGFGRAENLKRAFKRAIRDFHRAAEADIFMDGAEATVPEGRETGVPLAPYATKPFPIRLKWKGRTYKAKVRRDGRIRYRGKLYNSPSTAASVVRRWKASNGWVMWLWERAPGDWVPLDTLRR